MKSRSGPEFRQQARPLKKCPGCHGRGVTKGVFYEMPCPDCNAGGVVCKETGQALAVEDLVVQLRLWLGKAMEDNRRLRRRFADSKADDSSGRGYGETRGRGPMGMKYHGD
ncbi:hypothetical protein ACJO2E_02535 [Marinobacter sp. M1N3S26]|uniref:hypothetical protein n=1 Tax=Marinobacter sp. M1N3S26 TaxID=3382299 RepID=UPI00387AB764